MSLIPCVYCERGKRFIFRQWRLGNVEISHEIKYHGVNELSVSFTRGRLFVAIRHNLDSADQPKPWWRFFIYTKFLDATLCRPRLDPNWRPVTFKMKKIVKD